jgi:hypothetical protein
VWSRQIDGIQEFKWGGTARTVCRSLRLRPSNQFTSML